MHDTGSACFHNHVGENCERVNANIGPAGERTKYMSPVNRAATLERTCFKHNEELDLRLPRQLQAMKWRNDKELHEALAAGQVALAALHEELGHGVLAGSSADQVKPGCCSRHVGRYALPSQLLTTSN